MDNDAPFRFHPPSGEPQHSTSPPRSSRAGAPLSSRSSQSTSTSEPTHRMSIYSTRPYQGALLEPRQFDEESPAPPRPLVHPPPLAPYVREDQRIRPPPVHAWGTVPDPGMQQYHNGNAPPYLPGPVHSPPKGNRWRQMVHRDHHSPPGVVSEQGRPSHSAPVASSSHRHIVHPPPQTADSRITLPPLSAALSSTSMDRTHSRASEQSAPLTRTYSRSQEGSSKSRPSSHGSSGGGAVDHDPRDSIGASGNNSSQMSQVEVQFSRKKRQRALFTPMQQEHLKRLWKQNKFPAVNEREALGVAIGLNHRQIQVWFQNQRQKMRKEINTTGIPNDADPLDYNDLDKSPKSRRMSLEAAARPPRVSMHATGNNFDEVGPWNTNLSDEKQSPKSGQNNDQQTSQWRPRDLAGNPVTGSIRPPHRHIPYLDHPYHSRPSSSNTTVKPQAFGYRSSGPPSPMSYHGMSPPPDHTTSPTRPTFASRERRRPTPVEMLPSTESDREPMRSSVGQTFGDMTSRQPRTQDAFSTVSLPRRRSTSLEGMRPHRSPSPTSQPLKRTRTNTNTSQLPPSLAALALSGPINTSSESPRRLPSLSSTQDHHNGLPMSAPTLPPPRGWPQDRGRNDSHYPPHTANPASSFPRTHSDLPGPGALFYQQDQYRR